MKKIKRRKSRGEGNKKLKMTPRFPDDCSRREYYTLQYMIKDASKSGKTHSCVFQNFKFINYNYSAANTIRGLDQS